MKKLLALLALVALSGCSQLSVQPEQLDPKVYYNHDLNFSVNNVEAVGIYTAPIADVYTIKIEDRDGVDQMIVSTCKRTEVLKKEQGGIFKRKKGFTYVYVPGLLEKVPGCRLDFTGLDSNNNKNAFGSVGFENKDYTLKTGVSCNAIPDYTANGLTICEAAKGQLMQLWAWQRLDVEWKDERCKLNSSTGVSFQIKLAPRECIYVFSTVATPKEFFHLTTFGDEQVLIRGD